MLKKTITYFDFNGVEHTDDYYFNISPAEFTKMEAREMYMVDGKATGGMSERLQRITKGGSGQEIMDTFEQLLKDSYGVRSEDGTRFVKSEKAWEDFRYSGAYDEFFMELMTDTDAASNFVNSIMPKKLQDHLPKGE